MLLSLALACASPEPVETPFEGPGYDPEVGVTLAQDTFVLAVTELHVKNAPGPGKTFGEHANAIGEHLYSGQVEIPDFVGGSFRNIGQLEWWTLSVWADEASMMEFVLSEPHVSAMADLSVVSRAARSTHVEIAAADIPVDWDLALDTLADVDWIVGGEP
jgi:hypothetical protein